MELKHRLQEKYMYILSLLIVPYGIETPFPFPMIFMPSFF